MRAVIFIGVLMHVILLLALYSWVNVASEAMASCQIKYSYDTCATTLR
jgi:hypothetical protein